MDPLFVMRVVTAGQLGRKDLELAFAGGCGALTVGGMLTGAQVGQALDAAGALPAWSYPGQCAGEGDFGPSLKRYVENGGVREAYWAEAEACGKAWSTVMSAYDPAEAVCDALGAAWGVPVKRATVGRRQVHRGILRSGAGGAAPHTHDPLRDLGPQLLDGGPCMASLLVKVPLTRCRGGGQTLIHRARWAPEHASGRSHPPLPQTLTFEGLPGDVLLHDPRWYHSVRTCAGGGRRLVLEFYVGVTGDGELVAWS